MSPARLLLVAGLGLLASAVLGPPVAGTPRTAARQSEPARGPGSGSAPAIRFVDATEELGIDFVHDHGGAGERFMVETMGSGVGLADLDVDGLLDPVFAQGAPTPGSHRQDTPRNAAWRGRRTGAMSRIPDDAGLGSTAWSMGIAIADYDDDGFPDVYVTNFGANELLRNNGDGTFTDVSDRAGIADPSWSSSAAWADLEGDGDLDLYVVNYVDFAWDNHKFCGDPRRNLRAYCHPDVYNAVADRLYRNAGDGTFTEIGEATGIADTLDGKGLGVVFGDYDDDGDPDPYVANDSTRNFLYTNVDGSRLVEDGLLAGVGFNEHGQAEAGMGTDWGDADGDLDLDVFVTNLDLESNTFYRNLGGGAFEDATRAAGLAEPSLQFVGFGTHWLDVDHDGDLDLFVANGHIIDNIAELREGMRHAQPNHLYLNDSGAFVERSAELGPGFEPVKVSRGSAIGDLDGDGDLDVVVSNNGQRADVLRNEGGSAAGRWLRIRLVGRAANRTAAGARIRVALADGTLLLREVTAGSSYASSSDPTVHVGLGDSPAAEVTVRWPGGGEQTFRGLDAGRKYVVVQGRAPIARGEAGR